jgi:hypothetical protein
MLQKLKKLSLVLVILLASCSTTTFIYDRINFILPWYLGSFVDLDAEQREYLDELIVPFLDWHQTNEMPFYQKILDVSESLLLSKRKIKADDIATVSVIIEDAWFRLEKGSMKWMLPLGRELSSKQIDGFLEVMSTNAQEYKNKRLSRTDEQYQQDAFERIKDNLSKFMGKLSREQIELVNQATSQFQRADRVWYEKRIAMLNELEEILVRDVGWEQELLYVMNSKGNAFSRGYSEIYSHNLNVSHEMFAAVLNIRTKEQDKRLRQQINKYRTDIENIIKQQKDNQELLNPLN